MTPALPVDKLKKIQGSCQELIACSDTTVRKLTKVIEKLIAAVKTVLPAPLHYRHLRRQNKGVLQGKLSYQTVITQGDECVEELRWWIESITQWNGRSMIRPSPDWELTITTDASKSGWGTECADVVTQALWTEIALEMKAVIFAVKAFTKDKRNCHV